MARLQSEIVRRAHFYLSAPGDDILTLAHRGPCTVQVTLRSRVANPAHVITPNFFVITSVNADGQRTERYLSVSCNCVGEKCRSECPCSTGFSLKPDPERVFCGTLCSRKKILEEREPETYGTFVERIESYLTGRLELGWTGKDGRPVPPHSAPRRGRDGAGGGDEMVEVGRCGWQ